MLVLQNTDVSRCQCCRYSHALCGGSKLVGRESRDAGLCVDFNQHVADVVRACIMHTRALRHILTDLSERVNKNQQNFRIFCAIW